MLYDVKVSNLASEDWAPPVRVFFDNLEDNPPLRLALSVTATVCYSALSPRLRVKYPYDTDLSMLLVNLLIIGFSGAGKGTVRKVVFIIMKMLIEREMEERRIYREALEANKRRNANKDKDKEPLVAIRFLQSFTLPVVVKYCDHMHRRYGDWLSFFLFGNELGSFIENKRNKADFQAVSRCAYNLGELYSRDTLYEAGYNGLVDICWNSVICGQEQSLHEYIDKKGVVVGDAGRQIVIKLRDSLGEKPPVFHPLTDEQQKIVDTTVKKLMEETFTDDDKLQPIHVVDMSWLDENVKDWCSWQRFDVIKTGSRAQNSFYVRASVSAFRLCTMLYHLWGETEESKEHVRRCYYAFANYILDKLVQEFGQIYESAMPKEKECTAKIYLYDQMPRKFTRKQLSEKIAELELGTAARQFLYKWKKANLIWKVEEEEDTYEKIYE